MKYDVSEYTTKRGSKGLIISVTDAPVVSMDFEFRAGYRYGVDFDHKSQVAHLLEHMMCRINNKYRDPIKKELAVTKNGASSNASTGSCYIGYDAYCADFEWQRIMELMRYEICQPYFTEQSFKAEMSTVRSELTNYLSQPWRMLSPKVAQTLGDEQKTYPEHIESLDNISLKDIKEHYRLTHQAENMHFIVAGDFTDSLDRLYAELEKFDLPTGGEWRELPCDVLHTAKPTVIKRKDVPAICFTFCMEQNRELTDEECEAMSALEHILSGTMSSRIYGQARDKGLLYGCTVGCSSSKYNTEWYLDGRANAEQLPAFFDLAVRELDKVKRGDITEQELADAKSYALGRYRMGIQTTGQLARYLSGRWLYDGLIKDYNDEPDKINGVTREQMVELVRQFFDANIWTIGLYGATDNKMANQLRAKLKQLF